MGNVVSGNRPTAKELREEREALRLWRAKEIQNLRDLKAGMEVDMSKNEFKDDIVKTNIRIEAAIAYLQGHNEDEGQLFLDVEKPRILAFIGTFRDRARVRSVIKGIADAVSAPEPADEAASATTLKSADKKVLIALSATLQDYLSNDANFGVSSDEIGTFLAAESEKAVASILKSDTTAKYKTYIQDILTLSEGDIQRIKVSPRVVKNTTYISPNYWSIIVRTILICLVVGVAITGGMLAANDAIHRPLPFRLLNFVYGSVFCVITLPYYLVRWLRDKAPKYYALLPLYERVEAPNTAFRELIASMFSYVKDDYYLQEASAFKAQQDAMSS